MKNLCLKFIFTLLTFFSFTLAANAPQEVVQLADYISVDYADAVKDGVVINDFEYKEMVEFAKRINQLSGELNLDSATIENIQTLNNLITHKAQPNDVAVKARAISMTVSQKFDLIVPPKMAPDLAQAKVLYQQNCASCHGDAGQGDGLLAAHQEPAPTDFHDAARASLRSVNGLYNTITMGVEETGMVPYQNSLSDQERWALALYVSGMYASADQVAHGKNEWEKLSSDQKAEFTPQRLVSRTPGEEKIDNVSMELVAYLRQNPDQVWPQQKNLWAVTQQILDESFIALQNNEPKKAYQLSLSAYLDGFEMLEPVVDAFDSKMRLEIEELMMSYREAVQKNDINTARQYYEELKVKIAQAEKEISETESSFTAVFLSAFIILLREGMEIILVLAVMFVLVKRMEQKSAIPYIHGGWISAIVAGLGLWYLSHQFITISGASREITEGVLALLAAAILFYVGFWIHRQSSSQQWQEALQGQMTKQLAQRSLLGLSFIAFIAVFREMLEIALFYETLWLQTDAQKSSAIITGISTALVLLIGLAFAVNKLSVRLPIGKFFSASSIVIIVLAVVFLGSGLQALAEAGKFPIMMISSLPTIELLGIYPNLWTVLSQLILAVIGVWVWYKKS